MIFGGDESDQIFECKIDDSPQQLEYGWKLNEQLKMPHNVVDEQNYDVLVVNEVIIVVYFGESDYFDVWCLDLMNTHGINQHAVCQSR